MFISTVLDHIPFEQECQVTRFKQFLPAGLDPHSGVFRERDMVQFYSDPPGLRTVNVKDIRRVR